MTDQTTPAPLPGSATEPQTAAPAPSGANRCRCGIWWAGMSTAHCASCHITFTSVSGFTLHRKGGTCATPADLGMVLSDRKYPAWALPGAWTGPEETA